MHVMPPRNAIYAMKLYNLYQLIVSLSINSLVNLLGNMPRKCNDHDLIIYSELKPTKQPVLPVHPIPDFKPFIYISKYNTLCIPTTIDSSDLEALFKLFFEDSTI